MGCCPCHSASLSGLVKALENKRTNKNIKQYGLKVIHKIFSYSDKYKSIHTEILKD